MRLFGILLDLCNNVVVIHGVKYLALSSEEDTIKQTRRSAVRVVEDANPTTN